MKVGERVRIALVGCGAVATVGYLPAIRRSASIDLPATMGMGWQAERMKWKAAEVTVLIDRDLARAEALAAEFGIPYACADYRAVLPDVDAAILALPHALHAPIGVEFLRHGIHVLVEKPMALNVAECDALIGAARQNGATLAVGIVRRFLPSYQFVKVALQAGLLGKIVSFDVREGAIYGWPVASDFFFRKETAGGGVLIDTGAYTMDMVQWWFGNCKSLEYFDDSMGGVEANCEINLQMEDGVQGHVELSRTRNLRNTVIVRAERGTIEMSLHTPSVSIALSDSDARVVGNVLKVDQLEPSREPFLDLLRAELEDWVEAIIDRRPPSVSGEEGRKSVALIEACYGNRRTLQLPWESPNSTERTDA